MTIKSQFLGGWLIAALGAIGLLNLHANPILAQYAPPTRYVQRTVDVPLNDLSQSPLGTRVSANGDIISDSTGTPTMPMNPGRPYIMNGPMNGPNSGDVIGSGSRYPTNVYRSPTPYYEQVPAQRLAPSGSPAIINENGDVVEGLPGNPLPNNPVPSNFAPGNLAYETDGMTGGACCGPSGNCCSPCWCLPIPQIRWDNLSVFGGLQGFTGPPNNGSTGSFGFQEGVNFGDALPFTPCGEIGWQLGARFTQSNLSGADFTLSQRNQQFVTAGLFRRADWGLQGGVAVDYLHENWYFQADLCQIRGELSWVYPCKHEFGFWFATSAKTQTVTTTTRNANNVAVVGTANFASTDLYAFFYRRRFGDCDSSYIRAYGGFSGDQDGLIGIDGTVAISDNWAYQTGFTYLIPSESKGAAGNLMAGAAQEAWNFSMAIVWYPSCMGAKSKNYNRPLFNVADNGSFILDRK